VRRSTLIAIFSVVSMLGIVAGVAMLTLSVPIRLPGSPSQRLQAEFVLALAGAASAAASALALTSPAKPAPEIALPAGRVGQTSGPQEFQGYGASAPTIDALSDDLEELLGEIAVVQESQSRLMRDIGHDLRSPLASIVSMSECMRLGDFGPVGNEQFRACELLETTARRLLARTEALYALHEGREGTDEGHGDTVDVGEVLTRVTEGLRPHALAKQLSLEIRVPDSAVYASCDLVALERIVAHLVDNAIKFTEHGSVAAQLTTSDEEIRVTVRDTGIGITPEDLERVTEKYFRVDTAGQREGSGVGLAVVNELAAAIGGSLSISSTLGEGSCFTLTLPHAVA